MSDVSEPVLGADPKQPIRTAADWAGVLGETMAGDGTGFGAPAAAPTGEDQQSQQVPQEVPGARYTEEDIQRVRREEKDKVYGRIEEMSTQLKALNAEREAAEAARQAEVAAKEAQVKREEEEKMETRQLLEVKEQEWASRFSELESKYEQDKAVFDKERAFQRVEQYKQDRVAQESEYIMPELRDLIGGSDEAAIDQSIEEMKNRTAAIMAQVQQSAQDQRQQMRGAAPTAPPVGPMEQMQTYETITAEDIGSMDMETYRKYRETLLNAAGRAYRG